MKRPKIATSACLSTNHWFAGILIILLGSFVYSSVFYAQFLFDDDILITNNVLIQASNGLSKIWFSTQPVDYFPITNTAFWIEWRLFGDSPLGYHVVNLVLHLIASLLIWAVLDRLMIPGSWLAAILFAIHPVAVPSVAWISEQKNTLSICFYLLSILAYLAFLDRQLSDQRRRRDYVFALAAFLLALLAKPAVVVLPVILLMLIWWKRRKVTPRDIFALVPFFALALVMGLVTIWFQLWRITSDTDIIPLEPWLCRIAGTGRGVWFYLYKAIAPLNLTIIYPKWIINPADLLSYLPLTLLLALFTLLIYLSAHRRLAWSRAALFAFACFVITLCPVLGIVRMAFRAYSPVADHLQYFALPAITALLAAAIVTLAQRCRSLKLPMYFLAFALVLTFTFLAWVRVQFFQDIETVSRQNIAVNPDAAFAWHNLGYALAHQAPAPATLQAAADAFNCELKIFPASVKGTLSLARILIQSGQLSEALSRLNSALALNPDNPLLLYSRGYVRGRLNDTDGAIADFQSSIRADSDKPDPHNSLGNILSSKSQFPEAIRHYRRAIELDPKFGGAHLNLANALFRTGDLNEAAAEYQTALQLNPQSATAHFKFAVFLLKQGNPGLACQHAQAALELDPGYAPAREILERAKAMSNSAPAGSKN